MGSGFIVPVEIGVEYAGGNWGQRRPVARGRLSRGRLAFACGGETPPRRRCYVACFRGPQRNLGGRTVLPADRTITPAKVGVGHFWCCRCLETLRGAAGVASEIAGHAFSSSLCAVAILNC